MMDERTIRKWFSEFKGNNQLTEIRILAGKKTFSGYFTDADSILREIAPYEQCNIYFTLNAINPACYSRMQRDRILPVGGDSNATSASDIIGRDFVLIDIDPVRPSGTNSSDAELAHAKAVARKVFKFLQDQGFYHPAVCCSGNGVHLILRARMKNNDANTQTVKKFLEALDMLFSDDVAHIDIAPHDPNRICRLYGTVTRKGTDQDPSRPQRLSEILYIPPTFGKENENEYSTITPPSGSTSKPSSATTASRCIRRVASERESSMSLKSAPSTRTTKPPTVRSSKWIMGR